MSSKNGFRLLSVLLIVAASVLTMNIAGPSFVSPANASGVSDWKNSDVTAVAVGREHTCAIETGVLYCWGAGTNGQLGYAPTRVGFTIPPPTDQSKAIKVASAPGLGFNNTTVTAIAAAERTTCALEGGVVFCWGANNTGAVGDGTLVSKTVPHKVVNNDGFMNNGVTAIGVGLTSCAVRGGELFCWGSGRFGQIGNGTTTDDNPRPRRVASVAGGFQNSSVSAVTVTSNDVCATRLETVGGVTNPVMYCWGRGGSGNHGTGDMQLNVTRPRKVTPVAGAAGGTPAGALVTALSRNRSSSTGTGNTNVECRSMAHRPAQSLNGPAERSAISRTSPTRRSRGCRAPDAFNRVLRQLLQLAGMSDPVVNRQDR
jgi:hypothetical protein